jgi:hypothetical protein
MSGTAKFSWGPDWTPWKKDFSYPFGTAFSERGASLEETDGNGPRFSDVFTNYNPTSTSSIQRKE